MKSPLLIILELLIGLIGGVIETVAFVAGKLGELFISLVFISRFGAFGLVIASIIGGIVFLFAVKFVFKTWKSLIALGLAVISIFLVLILLHFI